MSRRPLPSRGLLAALDGDRVRAVCHRPQRFAGMDAVAIVGKLYAAAEAARGAGHHGEADRLFAALKITELLVRAVLAELPAQAGRQS